MSLPIKKNEPVTVHYLCGECNYPQKLIMDSRNVPENKEWSENRTCPKCQKKGCGTIVYHGYTASRNCNHCLVMLRLVTANKLSANRCYNSRR